MKDLVVRLVSVPSRLCPFNKGIGVPERLLARFDVAREPIAPCLPEQMETDTSGPERTRTGRLSRSYPEEGKQKESVYSGGEQQLSGSTAVPKLSIKPARKDAS